MKSESRGVFRAIIIEMSHQKFAENQLFQEKNEKTPLSIFLKSFFMLFIQLFLICITPSVLQLTKECEEKRSNS